MKDVSGSDVPLSCADARELMLEAALAELRGTAVTPLARHLRACAECAAAASRVVQTQDRLAEAIDTLVVSATATDRVVAAGGAASTDRVATTRDAGTWRLLRTRALLPLAAAAALVVVLLSRTPSGGTHDLEPILPPRDDVPATAAVNASDADAVAVMRTSNPNITVVWTFRTEETQ